VGTTTHTKTTKRLENEKVFKFPKKGKKVKCRNATKEMPEKENDVSGTPRPVGWGANRGTWAAK